MAMNLSEYARLAQLTASTNTKDDKRGHGQLGLIGEAGELIDILKKMRYMGMTNEIAYPKLVDELGDLWWYIVELCEGMDASIEGAYGIALAMKHYDRHLSTVIMALIHTAVEISWYRNDAKFQREQIPRLMVFCFDIGNIIGVTPEEVWQHNIDKLRARYPEGFDAGRSNARYGHD